MTEQEPTIKEIIKKTSERGTERKEIQESNYDLLLNFLRDHGRTVGQLDVSLDGARVVRMIDCPQYGFPDQNIPFTDSDGTNYEIRIASVMGPVVMGGIGKPTAFLINFREEKKDFETLCLIKEERVEDSDGDEINDVAKLKKIEKIVGETVKAYRTLFLGTVPALQQ